MIDTIVKYVTGLVKLRGGTDNTIIGNVGNRLNVEASFTSGEMQAYSSKLRYIDMNASNGGVARGTSITNAAWVDIYSYTGSGLLLAFVATLETGADWGVRLLIDGEEIFGPNGISTDDMISDTLYDMDYSGKSANELFDTMGLVLGVHNQFRWSGPLEKPVKYSTSVVIKVKRDAGAAAKKFQAGLIISSKET